MPTLAVITIPSDTGIIADAVTHNWVIDADIAVTSANPGTIENLFEDWYNVAFPGVGVSPGTYLSPTLNTTAGQPRIALYDIAGALSGGPHGSPFDERAIGIVGNTTGTPLPSEVAVVVTLEAVGRDTAAVEVGVTRPKQRRTGRIFFGPLISGASQNIAGVARPNVSLRQALRENTKVLHAGLNALVGSSNGLGVWSRSDAAVRALAAVSTDDAFDTQRRRGEAPTARERLLM